MTSVGYLNGRWVDVKHMALGIDDIGFLQGVTAVERMRTWNGRLRFIDAHLQRFLHTTQALIIGGLPDSRQVTDLVHQLLSKNAPPLSERESESDSGIVLFATPGRRGGSSTGRAPSPTLGLHLSPLDFSRLERMQREGQPLVITDIRQPPIDCWPRDIKVRCRIHYYLADHQAREHDPEALGVLIDDDGSITETSAANVVLASDGRLLVPPVGRILPGVMLAAVCDLAKSEGIAVERRPISPQALRDADEVMLTGTEAGLWPARQIDGRPKPPGPICRRLQQLLQTQLMAPA